MKKVFTEVINKRNYDLNDILKKIDAYHIEGKLTDDEKSELYDLARNNKTTQYDVMLEIEKLWSAIKELQDPKIESGEEIQGAEEAVAEYVQPTGAHDAYMAGNKVLYNGKIYVCVMSYCVYSPDVYPAGWEIVE